MSEGLIVYNQGSDDPLFTARLIEYEGGYILQPRSFPWTMFVSMNLFILAFFGGMASLVSNKGNIFGLVIVSVIYIVTVSLLWGIAGWQYKKVREQVAWMDVDFRENNIYLLAYEKNICFDDIDHFKCVKTMKEDAGEDQFFNTELSLVTKDAEQYIILSSGSINWKIQYRLSKDFSWKRS